MARESVLTTAEKDAIKIEKLIFHIILKDQIAPIFLDKVIITESQQKFFKARLSDAAQGRQPDFVIVSPKNLRQRVLLFSDVLPSALFGYKPPCSEVA